jgi:signal transduction histidine kinase
LINNVLDLSKIEAGQMELHLETVDLKEKIHSAVATANGLRKDKPLTFEERLPNPALFVWTDSLRVQQVLLNLLSNAQVHRPGKIGDNSRRAIG